MLVAGALFMVLNLFTMTAVLGNARVTESARDATDINQEARLLLNRMSRELREAHARDGRDEPRRSSGTRRRTPRSTRPPTARSPSRSTSTASTASSRTPPTRRCITYRYDRAAERVLLQAGGQTLPVLAANVTAFSLTFTSRQFDLRRHRRRRRRTTS